MKKTLLIIFIILLSVNVFSEDSQFSYDENYFIDHFEQVLEGAKKTKTAYSGDFEIEKKAYDELKKQVDGYLEKIDIYKNLLILPDVSISVLEKSFNEINVQLSTINSRISALKSRLDKIEEQLVSVEDKIRFSSEIIKSRSKDNKDNLYIEEIKNYNSILQEQKKLLLSVKNFINSRVKLQESLYSSLGDLQLIFEKDIKDKKDVILFQKEEISLKIFSFKVIYNDFIKIFEIFSSYFTHSTLLKKQNLLKEHLNTGHFVAVFAFLILAVFFLSIRKYLLKNEKYKSLKQMQCGYPLDLIESSMFLILLLFLVEVFIRSKLYIVFPDVLKFLRGFTLVLLFTRLGSVSLRLISLKTNVFYVMSLFGWRNFLVWGVRFYALIYLGLSSFASFENTILLALRVVFELFLCIVVFLFWFVCKRSEKYKENHPSKVIEWWSKGIVVSGLLLEVAGFRYLTSWWFISWGKTIILICVVFIFYQALESLRKQIHENKPDEDVEKEGDKSSYYWLFSKGAYFLIVCFFISGIAFAWGKGESFLDWIFVLFSKKYIIGKIELSFAGFFYSGVVVFLTYIFTAFWKKMMKEYFFKESGLSEGVKDSITTISVYLVWTAGILISFSVLGFNSTSMVFGFGALGIGLGFGLQNIFNNFISGLILLFERPIQVGDVVEVGGVWGEVVKINVRSTLVQTYTHSSLIIPNSEFISAQVINWSHRDPFIRRDLNARVSYSSDTALVEKVLLQAANKVPEIRLYPKKPIVQFIAFGESGMEFRVRFWSTIDDFLVAESKLRFAIAKIFKENNIEIPIPKRDIYIKSDSVGDLAEVYVDQQVP
ncbi:MAG: mechanosensitive ion channel [Desulforegulaceae bacterium]|nr:mechanosensitive ion channel [Desulforegulaceae bacterium]